MKKDSVLRRCAGLRNSSHLVLFADHERRKGLGATNVEVSQPDYATAERAHVGVVPAAYVKGSVRALRADVALAECTEFYVPGTAYAAALLASARSHPACSPSRLSRTGTCQSIDITELPLSDCSNSVALAEQQVAEHIAITAIHPDYCSA